MSHANNPCYCCPVTESWLTLCDPMNYSTLVHLVLHSLPEFAQTHVHWVDNAIQPSHRLSSPPSPPALNLSRELALHIRWSKYWGFSIHPSNEYSGLISFRMDWFDLRAVQGALKSLLQHHNSKAPILQCSAFFMVQLSNPYMTTAITIALTRMDLCQQSSLCFLKCSLGLSGFPSDSDSKESA